MSAKGNLKELRLAGEPRVQLLPPLVRQREEALRTRRMAVFAILVAVAIAFAGTAFGYLRSLQAQSSLEAARELTAQILAEQGEYVEASQMARLIADTENARRDVTTNEVDWLELVNRLAGYVPAGSAIATIGMQAPAPWEAVLTPEGELRAERVAQIEITLVGPDYLAASAFVTGVYGMEGVADAFITGTVAEEGGYKTTVSVTFDADVRLERFAPVEEEQPADSESSEAEGDMVGEAAP